MAKGSRRTTPICPTMAAVVSEPMVAALYTPSSQLNASTTSGVVSERRPPNRKAELGKPFGSSQAGSSEGQGVAATVTRDFACAALRAHPGVHAWPVQSVSLAGGASVMPSHHTSPSGVSATLVKMVSLDRLHAVGVRVPAGAGRDAEESRLG